jgi:hypothetical protein
VKTLSERNLLLVWETGLQQSLIERSLALLELVFPEFSPEKSVLWSIGERDARLLQVRELLFGSTLHNTANCPFCGTKTEWESLLDSFKLQTIGDATIPNLTDLNHEGYQIRFRLPNSADLLELADASPDVGTDVLLQKCIVQASHHSLGATDLPVGVKERIIREMEKNDPQANISLQLSCPDCKQEWVLNFDIMQYLWMEIDAWARRTIGDIGLLAYHFKWSENDILGMSRFRRNLYLNMITG